MLFILYKTDVWHFYDSRDLLGICTSKKKAIKLAKQQAKKEGEKIKGDALYELTNLNQTQSYKGEGEFYIEEITKNTLL